MLKVSPLFSGSRGNSTLIQSDNTNILLDAGYGCRYIVKALESRGLTPKDIDAIVISHEHTDHVGALPVWTRSHPTPIFAPTLIADYLRQRVYVSEVYDVTGSFVVGDISVDVYECSHDARACCGYRFGAGQAYFACVTDTGCVTDELVNFLTPCSTIMLESNHDVDMLIKGPYSYPLKQRILSDFGHLSNEQASVVLDRLGRGVHNVILAHLSEKNNTRELAFSTVVNMYASKGIIEGRDVNVYVADQYSNEVTICID